MKTRIKSLRHLLKLPVLKKIFLKKLIILGTICFQFSIVLIFQGDFPIVFNSDKYFLIGTGNIFRQSINSEFNLIPIINLNKNKFNFSAIKNGSLPLSQELIIMNGGDGTLQWNISDDADWLDLNPISGSNNGTINLSINTTNKEPGYYNALITVSANGANNSPQNVTVTYTVYQKPMIGLDKYLLTFNSFQNGTLPPADSIKIINIGSGSFNWIVTNNVTWLNISPINGEDTGTIKVSVNATNMNVGIYSAKITISSIEASNSPQLINVSYFLRLTYPSTLNVNKTIEFPSYSNLSEYKVTDYKLFGLPGKSEISIKDYFTGIQGVDWQVFWDNGLENNYLVDYDGSSAFLFTSGRAFWILKRNPLIINTVVNSVPLNAQYQVEIPLHSGWNIISNPYTSAILWSKIQSANNTNSPIWKFDGKFEIAADFHPFNGYYFDNRDNLLVLKIPYGEFSLSSNKNIKIDPSDWSIDISLCKEENIQGSISLGVSSQASKTIDKFDFRKPRSLEETKQSNISSKEQSFHFPVMFFDRSTWSIEYRYLASDIRPYFEELESWDITVEGLEQNTINSIRFSNLNSVPIRFQKYFLDIDRNRYINLVEDSVYYFTSINSSCKFSVIIGKNDLIKERVKNAKTIKDYLLNQNYPNPFNSTTIISLTIPVISEILLSVCNLLGKEIKVIYSGAIPSGSYSFVWKGDDQFGNQQASGIYIYRLIINSKYILLRKMILMK